MQKTMTYNGGTVMGIEQCIYLLEHINYQLVYNAATAKSAFLQNARGPGGVEGACGFES